MSFDYREKYELWCRMADEETKKELALIQDDETEIKERFYKDLSFGTAGLRGIIGAGTDRMNMYTVCRATQGLADYILQKGAEAAKRGVAISYDCRHFSKEFAWAAASVLAANGIRVFIYNEMEPTPALSFALRYVGAVSGIMITASHNPAKYNGYKVYGSDGAQLGVAESDIVLAAILKTDIFTGVRRMDASLALEQGLITVMDEAVLSAYQNAVCACLKNPDLVKEAGGELKIVYTPFHGTGCKPVMEALSACGFNSVYPVEAQMVPDPDFSTVRSPNPEEPDGFLMATALAKEQNADIIIGTDPDADRIGVLCKKDGDYVILNGNQTGVLLLDYILSQEKNLTKDDYVVSTIVSSNMVSRIADFYGVSSYRVYTGFKNIASIIKNHEDNALRGRYLFGFEESYGYLPGTYARDKDAVSAALLIAEAALYYKKQGKTLLDRLDDLRRTHGYFIERTDSVYMEGLDGLEKMQALLAKTAENPFKTIGSMAVRAFYNYQEGYRLDFESGEKSALSFEPANVLYFELPENGFFILRPSGTEPKIKLYFSVRGTSQENAQNLLSELTNAANELLS